ncbi:MAG: hypothetical protein H6834_05515 [Planctomycetes bacterium]|nr:hypothetical protein [Planctomycetota bacterium]
MLRLRNSRESGGEALGWTGSINGWDSMAPWYVILLRGFTLSLECLFWLLAATCRILGLPQGDGFWLESSRRLLCPYSGHC